MKNVLLRKLLLLCATALLSAPLQAQWIRDLPAREHDRGGQTGQSVEENDNPRAAEAWYWGQRASGLGYIPADGISKALTTRDAERRAIRTGNAPMSLHGAVLPEAVNAPWSLVGPTNVGGRINAIAIDPTDSKVVYCGAADGGVWKSVDGGTNWVPLTDQAQSLAMGAIGIDPNDTKTIFAGTGEVSSSTDSYSGYGVLVSHDGGATWQTTGPIDVGAYSRIIVNPKNSNIVYAAAGRSNGGVFRSTDGGKTWPRVTGGLPRAEVTDMALSMNGNTPVLYAALATLGLFRSIDGGDSWELVKAFSNMTRMMVDASVTDWQRVALISVYADGTLEGFVGSQDGGTTWDNIIGNLGPTLFNVGAGAQGWYDIYVRIDPSNEDHVMVGGISIWSSDDFGQSWTDVGKSYNGGVHPDQHALEFAPADPTTVYIGCDGGFYTSHDGGQTYSSLPAKMAITQFYRIGVDQSTADLTYGGTQDNGSVSGASSTGWAQFWGGDGGYTICDPNDPSRLYITTPNSPYPAMIEGGSYKNIGSSISRLGDTTTWLNPICLDAKNDILYYGSDHLHATTNHGTSWSSWTLSRIPDKSQIQSIAAFGDKVHVVVGTSGGHVYATTDNGRTWSDISSNLPPRWVTWLMFSSTDANTIYATLSGYGGGHVFKTTDGGASWNDISGLLPDIPVNTIVADPQNPGVLYIGTDIGVYLSPHDGDTWVPYGTGLPNTAVLALEIQSSQRVLRAGTHGRSLWEAPLVADLPGITAPTQRSVWTMGDAATIGWHGFASPVTISLSQDGGATWTQIADNVPGTSFNISRVEYYSSENALVKVSDGDQTITSPFFQIVQRMSGETLQTIGTYSHMFYDIAWDQDEKALWATSWADAAEPIYKLDPDNGSIIDSIAVRSDMKDLTGIKYDPTTKHLFIHQALPDNTSYWFEMTKTGDVLQKTASTAVYGTGILVRNDTLFLADRTTSSISRSLVSDQNFVFPPLEFQRYCLYGPRSLTYDAKLQQYLLAYTNFFGTSASDVRFNGSYLLYLDPSTGTEVGSHYMQYADASPNIRGVEWDPRGDGNTAWVTYLGSGTTSQLVKITLADGPDYPTNDVAPSHHEVGAMGASYPNPAIAEINIPFSTATAGEVVLRVVDNLGRTLISNTGMENPGIHTRSIDCSHLRPGSYLCELRLNGALLGVERITILR